MIEKLLTARLMTVTENVYPIVAPLNYKTPCAVYERIGTEAIQDLSGVSGRGLVTMQISVSSPLLSEALDLAKAVREAILSWEEPSVKVTSYINETVNAETSTQTTLFRVLLFFNLRCDL